MKPIFEESKIEEFCALCKEHPTAIAIELTSAEYAMMIRQLALISPVSATVIANTKRIVIDKRTVKIVIKQI